MSQRFQQAGFVHHDDNARPRKTDEGQSCLSSCIGAAAYALAAGVTMILAAGGIYGLRAVLDYIAHAFGG
jgi:hypothetical protein